MSGKSLLRRNLRTACLLAFAIILGRTGSLEAQFSGPALGVTQQPNQAQIPTTDPTILMPAGQDFVVNTGDVLVVRIFGVTDYSPPVQVSVAGQIQIPLVGLVTVAGLTISRAEDVIAQRLSSAGMYVNPQVTIQVTEAASRTATLAGEMHSIVPIAGNRRLLDVIAAGGGLPAAASHVITILRNGQDNPIVVDLGTDPSRSAQANIQILPGDKIIISRVGVVYVLGAFKAQGAIALTQNAPLTLMQATALSGGTNYEGKYNDLRVVRTVGLGRTVVKLNIKKILEGTAPDPVLQADDIVFLPSSAVKSAIKAGGIGTFTSIASLALILIQSKL